MAIAGLGDMTLPQSVQVYHDTVASHASLCVHTVQYCWLLCFCTWGGWTWHTFTLDLAYAPWKLDKSIQVLPYTVTYYACGTIHNSIIVLVRRDMFCELLFSVDVATNHRWRLVTDILEDAISWTRSKPSMNSVLKHFYAIQNRLVPAFTCAGMLPHHYINFSAFAGIETVGKW